MKPGRLSVPLRHWAVLAGGLTVLGVGLVLPRVRPVTEPEGAGTMAALRADLATLPPDAESQLTALRARQIPAAAHDPLAEARAALGGAWEVATLNDSDCYVFAARDPGASRWPEIVAAVQALESIRGLVVTAAKIDSAGSRVARHFSHVGIQVRLKAVARPSGNPVRRAPSHSPDRVPDGGTAGLRETGPVPPAAGLPPAPPAIPADDSGSRPRGASGPATRSSGR